VVEIKAQGVDDGAQRIQGTVLEVGQDEGPVAGQDDFQGGVAFGINLAAEKVV
jgi:hypothetical protein